MNWSVMQEMQAELDKYILYKHGIEKQDLGKLLVSASVEWHEAINETKFFKYWSNKEIDREKVLEEFSDFLHFLLSICNYFDYNIDNIKNYNFIIEDIDIYCLKMQRYIADIYYEDIYKKELLYEIINLFLKVINHFNLNEEELYNAYLKKNKINYKRQEEGY